MVARLDFSGISNPEKHSVAIDISEHAVGWTIFRGPSSSPRRAGEGSPGDYTETVTRKKVAGMEVASLLGLLFWLLNRASSSFCRSAARPFFSAARTRSWLAHSTF